MQKNKPEYYNNIDKVYIKIWDLLKVGLLDRNSALHIPVFTCGEKNNFDSRIIVLRGVEQKNRSIWFHSDIRSKKIKILENNSKGNFLFYDKSEKIQLKISGKTKVNYKNEITKKSWNKTSHMSRQCYLGKNGPGSKISNPTSGLSEKVDNFKYTIEESEDGYINFCVVETFINSIEWLYLAAKGRRRARFILKNDLVEKNWIIP